MKYDISTLEVPEGSVVVVGVKAKYSDSTIMRKVALIENALKERLGHDDFSVVVMKNGEKIEVMDRMDFQKKLGEGELIQEVPEYNEDGSLAREDDLDD